MPERRCGTCRFWEPFEAEVAGTTQPAEGICRRRAPNPTPAFLFQAILKQLGSEGAHNCLAHMIAMDNIEWPETREGQRCGEWAPREEPTEKSAGATWTPPHNPYYRIVVESGAQRSDNSVGQGKAPDRLECERFPDDCPLHKWLLASFPFWRVAYEKENPYDEAKGGDVE